MKGYTESLKEEKAFPHKVRSSAQAEDSISWYRNVLGPGSTLAWLSRGWDTVCIRLLFPVPTKYWGHNSECDRHRFSYNLHSSYRLYVCVWCVCLCILLIRTCGGEFYSKKQRGQ